MLKSQKYTVVIITLPSAVISLTHYSFAPTYILCTVIDKYTYIKFLYVVVSKMHSLYPLFLVLLLHIMLVCYSSVKFCHFLYSSFSLLFSLHNRYWSNFKFAKSFSISPNLLLSLSSEFFTLVIVLISRIPFGSFKNKFYLFIDIFELYIYINFKYFFYYI